MRIGDGFALVRETLLSRTGIDMGIVYGGKILEAAIGLVSNVIVARALGPEKLGVLMLVITFSSILTVVMGFGLDQTAVKYVADSRKMGTWPVQLVLGTALRLRLLFIIVGGIGCIALVPPHCIHNLSNAGHGKCADAWSPCGRRQLLVPAVSIISQGFRKICEDGCFQHCGSHPSLGFHRRDLS